MFNNFSFNTENIHPLLPIPYNLILPLIPVPTQLYFAYCYVYIHEKSCPGDSKFLENLEMWEKEDPEKYNNAMISMINFY